MKHIEKSETDLTITELSDEYCYQFKRTVGRMADLDYEGGWFTLQNSKYRPSELRRMLEGLRSRKDFVKA